MNTSTILGILRLLRSRSQVTAAQIAEAVGVSERTAYRYLQDLSSAGVPLQAIPGPGGGFLLSSQGTVNLGPLSPVESRSLFFPVGPLPQAELGLAFDPAIDKLLGQLPAKTRELVDMVRMRFYFDPEDWFSEAPVPQSLSSLRAAVWEDRLVEMEYRNLQGEVRRRVVEAWALVVKVNTWYLIGRDSNGGKSDLRTFRLSRIISCRSTDQTFQRDQSFDPGRHWRGAVTGFENNLPPNRVLVIASVHQSIQWYLPAYFEGRFHQVSATSDEWANFELSFLSEESARAQLLSLGSYIQVQSPISLRDAILRTAKDIVNRYQGDPVEFDRPLSDPLR